MSGFFFLFKPVIRHLTWWHLTLYDTLRSFELSPCLLNYEVNFHSNNASSSLRRQVSVVFRLLYLRICVKQLLSRQTLHDCSSSRVMWIAEMYARSSTPAGVMITTIKRYVCPIKTFKSPHCSRPRHSTHRKRSLCCNFSNIRKKS